MQSEAPTSLGHKQVQPTEFPCSPRENGAQQEGRGWWLKHSQCKATRVTATSDMVQRVSRRRSYLEGLGVDGLEEAEGFWRERGVAFQAEEMAATQLAGDPQGSHELCAHFPT